MRVGLPPASLLVERLVVPNPDGVDAEQPRGGLGDQWVKGQRADLGAVLPEVLALRETLFIARLLP